jgi:hypothetical protein
MAPLTFRNSKIIYYGPHPCENCGIDIAKMGREWGGTAFTYPQGPVYPNTEWMPHVCDPFEVRNKQGREAREQQLKAWPSARAVKVRELGYVIASGNVQEPGYVIASGNVQEPDSQYLHIISTHCCFHETELTAWSGAQRRQDENLPTWWMNINNGNSQSVLPL